MVGHQDHGSSHGQTMSHGGMAMAQDFLRRFFIVSALLVPLVIFSPPAVRFLGVPDFGFRPYLEFGLATLIFYFGLVFFEHARHEIATRQYGMMTLVSLAVGTGYLFSAAGTFVPAVKTEFYLEISTLIWVLLFGHFLEARSSTAAGNALQEVAKLLPKKAHLLVKGKPKEVALADLSAGDMVVVKPGEKVPADGQIIKGEAHFNEAHLTGESKPIAKKKGDIAVAGAICLDGSIRIKLSQIGENSTIGQIQTLITQAQQTKPSAQRLADKAAKWLTFSALTVAMITLLVWSALVGESLVFALTLAITVLVIACPHALGLAIPTVSTIATRLAVANGVFLKDMAKLEIIKSADYVVFDKTGTLTKGNFVVTDVEVFEGGKAKLLQVAGSIEAHSSHVIGLAIVEYIKEQKIKISQTTRIKNLAGKGMSGEIGGKAYILGNKRLMQEIKVWTPETGKVLTKLSDQGKTPVFVTDRKQILGVLALSDELKPESKRAVDGLHALGVKVAMVTGDTEAAATPIAKQLGIDTVFAQVLPEDKYKYIKELQDEGNKVIMAGDGINDAPALTQADIGVAIGAGTDVAVEAGDVVLTQSNPEDMVKLIILAKRVFRKMVENLFWAFGYNLVAIPAAAGLFVPLGFRLTPAIGALLMGLSSVIVVANALTLRKVRLAFP